MQKSEISVLSSDGRTVLKGCRYEPDTGAVRGVIQLVHDLEEHSGRYEALAEALTSAGFAFVAHDMLGHGASAAEGQEGFFSEKHGCEYLIKDIYRFTFLAGKQYADKPVFLLGQGFGGVLACRYAMVYPKEIRGVIFSGPVSVSFLKAHFIKRLAGVLGRIKGKTYKSSLLERGYRRGSKDPAAGLAESKAAAEAYRADPLCGRGTTVWGFKDCCRMTETVLWEKNRSRIPEDLSVLILSGMKNPADKRGKVSLRLYNTVRAKGLTDADAFFYKDDKKDLFHEDDAPEVFRDLIRWAEARC